MNLTTASITIYDERRESLRRSLSAISDKLHSNISIDQLMDTFENVIKRYISSEQEVFISYLMFLLMQSTNQIMPPFFEEFKESQEKLSKHFDPTGKINSILENFRGVSPNKLMKLYPDYLSKVVGVVYGTSVLHSFVNDARFVFLDFIKGMKRMISQTHQKTQKALKGLSTDKIVKKKNEEIHEIKKELMKTQEILKEKDKHRLELEGHAIRIIQYLNSIDPQKVEDTPTQLTLTELRKQSQSLRKALKATTSINKIEFNNTSSIYNAEQQKAQRIENLINQTKIKDETISQLRKEIEYLRKNPISQAQSFQTETRIEESILQSNLLKTRGELDQTKAVKTELMNEVVQKTDRLRDYYDLKNELDDLKLEYHAILQQKVQADEYAEVLNQENMKLKRENDELKVQLSSGTAGFDALYNKVKRLEEKSIKQKEKLQEQKERTKAAEEELNKKINEIQNKNKNLRNLSEDKETNAMKNELLMEQITNLKTEAALKEAEFVKFQKTLETQKKISESAQEKDNLRLEEIAALKEKINKIHLRKTKKDEKIQQLQKLIDSSSVKMQEKDMIMDKYELKVNDQKVRISTITDRLSKASETMKAQKNKIKDLENQMAELHYKAKDIERQTKRKDEEVKEMKEKMKNFNEIFRAKESLNHEVVQLKLEIEAEKQKNHTISNNLAAQAEASELIRNECNETKKNLIDTQNQLDSLKLQSQTQIAQLNNQIETLNYDMTKERERFEKEKKTLSTKIQQNSVKIKSFAPIREQYEKQIDEFKLKISQLQDQITEINSQNKVKIISLQQISQQEKLEFNEKIGNSERKIKELESDNQILNNRLEKLKDEYEEFKQQLATLLKSNNIYQSIEELQNSLENAQKSIQSIKTEVLKAKERNASLFNTMNVKIEDNASPFDQICVLASAVDASSQYISKMKKQQHYQQMVLKQANLKDFGEIPELHRNLLEAKQETLHYQGLLRQIGESTPFRKEENLPQIVADLKSRHDNLKEEKEHLLNIVETLHNFVDFEEVDDLVNATNSLFKENKNLANKMKILNKDFQETLKIKTNLEDKLNQIMQIIGVKEIDNVPRYVKKLHESNINNEQAVEKLTREQERIVNQVFKIVGSNEFVNEEIVSNNDSSIQNAPFNIIDQVQQLSQSNKKALNELKNTKKELEEKSNTLFQVQKIVNYEDEKSLPKTISKLLEKKQFFESEYKKSEEKHNSFVLTLSNITNSTDEEKIPLTIIKIYQQQKETFDELEKSKNDHRKFVESLNEIVTFSNEKHLPKLLTNLVEKQKILSEKAELLEKVGNIMHVHDESQIIKQITKINEESLNHQKMIKDFQSYISFSNEKEATQILEEKVKILTQIQSSLSTDNIRDIPHKIENLKTISESHTDLLDSVQRIVSYDREEQIPQILKQVVDRSEAQAKVIQNIEQIIPYSSPSISALNGSFSSFNSEQQFQKLSAIPAMVEQIVQEKEQMRLDHDQLINSFHQIVSFQDENEIPIIIKKLIKSNTKKSETISIFKSLIDSLHIYVKFDSIDELPQTLREMRQQLETLIQNDNKTHSILDALHTIIEFDIFDDLPNKVKDLNTIKTNFSQLLSKVQDVTEFESYHEIPSILSDYISYKKNILNIIEKISSNIPIHTIEDILVYSKEIKSTMFSVNEIEKIRSLSDIPKYMKIFKEGDEQNKVATNIIKQILSRIFGQNYSVSFPFDHEKSQKLLSSVTDYAIKHETMKLDFEKLIASARALGFSGNSCVEASDFLAEELCKKKAQEQLEEMVNQMRDLREDKDRERKLFEQRNAKNNEKLKEVRQAKAQLIEQYAQKQSELYDTIESLQRETRELETKVDKLSKAKEELIRVIAHEPYDKESLMTWLTTSEKSRIRL